jgi:hypothetical protein
MSEPAASELRAIDSVAAAFFAAFDSRGGRAVDMSGLRDLLLPEARIVKLDGDGAEVMDPDAFIAPREALLNGGTVTDFHEWEERAETTVFGAAASRRCVYRKAGLRDGEPIAGAGFKAISLVKLAGRWRIASVVWQDQAEGLELAGMEL